MLWVLGAKELSWFLVSLEHISKRRYAGPGGTEFSIFSHARTLPFREAEVLNETQSEWQERVNKALERNREIHLLLSRGEGNKQDLLREQVELQRTIYSRSPNADWLRLEECRSGYTYAIRSRNLSFGVFKESDSGFVGIREKFDSRFLFTEYHYDTNGAFGTARPYVELERCPVEDLREGLGSKCSVSGRPVEFKELDDDRKAALGLHSGARGWWFYGDNGAPMPKGGHAVATSIPNQDLFDYLESVEQDHSWDSLMNQK